MDQRGDYRDVPLLAAMYDLLPLHQRRPDVGFYVEICRNVKGPILELGCGTGRVLLPVARAGHRVVGLDGSRYMLAKCRAKLEQEDPAVKDNVELCEGEIADFDLQQEFAAITIPFRAFQQLVTADAQLACLTAIRRHLAADGMMVFDVFNPSFAALARPTPTDEFLDDESFALLDGTEVRRGYRTTAHHRARQVQDVELIYHLTNPQGQKQTITHLLQMRHIFRYELEHLLWRSGYAIESVYGDFRKSEFADDSPEIIVVARPREM